MSVALDKLITDIESLPEETLSELEMFVDYLRYKTTKQPVPEISVKDAADRVVTLLKQSLGDARIEDIEHELYEARRHDRC
ncbi:MAG: hypothetical protein HY709_10730 [Candidatus Latescibacteria bacterium]|nr:hypothetical protein [Candidatus Latescibacterota bacterium]